MKDKVDVMDDALPPLSSVSDYPSIAVGTAVLVLARTMIGETEIDAEDFLKAAGVKMRVMSRDGQRLMGIMNFDPTRANVAVENGVVVGVLDIG